MYIVRLQRQALFGRIICAVCVCVWESIGLQSAYLLFSIRSSCRRPSLISPATVSWETDRTRPFISPFSAGPKQKKNLIKFKLPLKNSFVHTLRAPHATQSMRGNPFLWKTNAKSGSRLRPDRIIRSDWYRSGDRARFRRAATKCSISGPHSKCTKPDEKIITRMIVVNSLAAIDGRGAGPERRTALCAACLAWHNVILPCLTWASHTNEIIYYLNHMSFSIERPIIQAHTHTRTHVCAFVVPFVRSVAKIYPKFEPLSRIRLKTHCARHKQWLSASFAGDARAHTHTGRCDIASVRVWLPL